MAWFCMNCGNIMHGATCGGRWRHKGKYVRCNKKYTKMESGAERWPRLDGFISINDDGTGVTRINQQLYDDNPCKRSVSIVTTRGVRPQGWDEALERIGERAYEMMQGIKDTISEC